MEQQKLTLSHSQISKAMGCGRSWELSYINGLERKVGSHSKNRLFGSAFHEGMAWALRSIDAIGYGEQTTVEMALEGVDAWVTDNREDGKLDYEGNLDVEYYDMFNSMVHQVKDLLTWFIPVSGLGTRYEVCSVYDILGSMTECGMCDGIGSYLAQCPECLDGQVECNCLDSDCGECDEGFYECDVCEGQGEYTEVCYLCNGEKQIPDTSPMVEYQFDYDLNDNVALRGYIDAVLFDTETGNTLIVDWKTRASMSDEDLIMLDQQLHLYSAVISKMADTNVIDGVCMWEIRTKKPAPATITKSGKPSVANNVGSTTADVWLASLTEEQLAKYGNDEFMATVKSIKPVEYFASPVVEMLSDAMEKLTLDNIIAQADQIAYYYTLAQTDKPIPAKMSAWGCKTCDFKILCSMPLRKGLDADAVVSEYYEYKEAFKTEKD